MKRYLLLVVMAYCVIISFAQQKRVTPNIAKESTAEELYQKAFDYLRGENGLPVDTVKAIESYKEAAAMGYAPAQYETYVIYYLDGQQSLALEWLLKAAAQNYTKAIYRLFLIYKNGDRVDKDVNEAVKWLKKGAELGDADCQSVLGHEYWSGVNSLGLPKDGRLATYWLEKAVAQNDDFAMMVLAGMYDEGKLVKRDIQKANELCRKAAELGNPNGAYNYAYAYEIGDGVDIDKGTAFKWMKKAAELGHIRAQLELAYFFATGYGCEKNETAARYWWGLVAKDENASEEDRKGAEYNISLLDQHIEIK